MTKTIVCSLLFFLSTLAIYAQDVDGDQITTFLIPISVPEATPGSRGTRWQTELWVHNNATGPISLRLCGLITTPCPVPLHEPGKTEMAFLREATSSNGGVLITNIEANVAADVTLSSRLFELSRNTQPAGIHVPVVREDRFVKKPSRFIGINGSATQRAALRIYDPVRITVDDPRLLSGAPFHVEVFTPNGQLLAEGIVRLTYPSSPYEPGFGALFDVAATFPQLREAERYDVRVTPQIAGMTYWALVSVTDNETQQVVLVTAD